MMEYRRLHPWNVSVRRAARIQEDLRSRLRLTAGRRLRSPRFVAGADVSFRRGSDAIHGAVVVLSYPDLRIVETATSSGRARFPYVPGYLSFREIPILLRAFRKIRRVPDVVLCDGQGIAHPRGFGLASHLGIILGVPTIGCAKSRLVGEHADPGTYRGEAAPLIYKGKTVGAVLRTRDGVSPLFISPGHRIDLESAVRLALTCCRGVRVPEPTRAAHMEVNRQRRKAAVRTGGESPVAGARPRSTPGSAPLHSPTARRGVRWAKARPSPGL
jgi:deoxyribonuclease V